MEARSERRSVVASGKTTEDAIANGLTMLGIGRGQADVEILNEGSRGVLGFGAENAQVRLTVKAPPEPVKVAAPAWEPEPVQDAVPAVEAGPVEDQKDGAKESAEAGEPSAAQVGQEILSDLLRLMGIRAKVEVSQVPELGEEGEPPPTVLNITGDDLGILIGRRGETLRAMQYLVRLMVSHRLKHWTNLVVDVENYRVRRRQTLETLALRVAGEVARTGRSQALEPMAPYDRRLVHIALRNHPQVATQSVGEGERRKVTVVPKP